MKCRRLLRPGAFLIVGHVVAVSFTIIAIATWSPLWLFQPLGHLVGTVSGYLLSRKRKP